MNSQLSRLLALLAACLVILTGGISIKNWATAPKQNDPPKRPTGVISSQQPKPKPPPTSEGPCTIKRAVFGGERAALIKVPKRGVHHYVVLDLPTDNPMMPFYQADWLAANYGKVSPQFIGEFTTVDDAVKKAAFHCKRN